MPLQVISSNQVEILKQHLAERLAAQPLQDPFEREVIIVPGKAMSRWLNLELARSLGVAANIDYPLAAAWIWQLAASLLPDVPDHDPLGRDSAAWCIYRCLPDQLSDPDFESLRQYLLDDTGGVRRWQLAVRIADVLDRYQFYRPQWLRAWQAGKSVKGVDAWQATLWRALVKEAGKYHRVALIDELVKRLQSSRDLSGQALVPQRVSLFALSSLPPLFIDVLRALAQHCEITLYQHSPTDQYWADLVSERQAARRRLQNADHAGYCETGNDLLVSWGRQGQAFQDLLLDTVLLDAGHIEDYLVPDADSMLHQLQRDILALDETVQAVEPDNTVHVAICHSALRECQVLHDQLLRELQADESLKPEDILVMVPEISRYAPYIEAVFRRDESGNRPFLPWNLSDLVLVDEHPLIRVFFQLLELPGSRFGFSEVMAILEVPEIADRRGFTQQDIDELYEVLQHSNVRWGLDAEHKQSLGLPAINSNTWLQAGDRLLAGYALGGEHTGGGTLWQGIAPIAQQGSARAEALGRFLLLLSRLRHWHGNLDQIRTGSDWQLVLNALLADFFPISRDDDDRVQQIRDVVDTLALQAADTELSLALLKLWLEGSLCSQTQRGRYFSGGVTFCGMRPMRSMPFRVICVLGMNDQVFPRRDIPVEFDAMAQHWQPGDPRKGDEDRYLLLETLLCSRDRLYFSYTGRSLKDNEPKQPSVLLRELLDFMDARYGTASHKISDAVSREHAMQPFALASYTRDPRSHDQLWCQVAHVMSDLRSTSITEHWPEVRLTAQEVDTRTVLALPRLVKFLEHPVKFFVQQRLRLYFTDAQEHDDREIFDLDGLHGWHVRQRMLDDALNGVETPLAVLMAEGRLPHGELASISQQVLYEDTEALLHEVGQYSDHEPMVQSLSLGLDDGIVLEGQIQGYRPGVGLLKARASKCKGKHLLALWLEHLALCAAGMLPPGETSLLFTRDRSVTLSVLPADEALAELRLLTDLYTEGLMRPLPVAPDASYALALALSRNKPMEKAQSEAWAAWYGAYDRSPGDENDEYIAMILQSGVASPIASPEFHKYAITIYGRLLQEASL